MAVASADVAETVVEETYRILQDYTFDSLDEMERRLLELQKTTKESEEETARVQRCVDRLAEVLQEGYERRFTSFERTVRSLFEKPAASASSAAAAKPDEGDVEMTDTTEKDDDAAAEDENVLERQRTEHAELAERMAALARRRDGAAAEVAAKERRLRAALTLHMQIEQLRADADGLLAEGAVSELVSRTDRLAALLA